MQALGGEVTYIVCVHGWNTWTLRCEMKESFIDSEYAHRRRRATEQDDEGGATGTFYKQRGPPHRRGPLRRGAMGGGVGGGGVCGGGKCTAWEALRAGRPHATKNAGDQQGRMVEGSRKTWCSKYPVEQLECPMELIVLWRGGQACMGRHGRGKKPLKG